jgi:hypothetical protein
MVLSREIKSVNHGVSCFISLTQAQLEKEAQTREIWLDLKSGDNSKI